MAAGVVRISDPLPAACLDRAKCSGAATSHGRPEPRTARVWLPTSGGPAANHRRNRSKTSASSSPSHSTSDDATSSAIWVSSVNSPACQPKLPPPHISVRTPRAGSGKPAENCPAAPNSNGAPSASPTAEPTSAPATRWLRGMVGVHRGLQRVNHPSGLAQLCAKAKLDGSRANVKRMATEAPEYRDSAGKALTDYWRPSVAVD